MASDFSIYKQESLSSLDKIYDILKYNCVGDRKFTQGDVSLLTESESLNNIVKELSSHTDEDAVDEVDDNPYNSIYETEMSFISDITSILKTISSCADMINGFKTKFGIGAPFIQYKSALKTDVETFTKGIAYIELWGAFQNQSEAGSQQAILKDLNTGIVSRKGQEGEFKLAFAIKDSEGNYITKPTWTSSGDWDDNLVWLVIRGESCFDSKNNPISSDEYRFDNLDGTVNIKRTEDGTLIAKVNFDLVWPLYDIEKYPNNYFSVLQSLGLNIPSSYSSNTELYIYIMDNRPV